MKRIMVIVVVALAWIGGSAHAATAGRQIGPGDGALGCDQSNLGVGYVWPDGSYHVCAWVYYRGYYWT